MRRTPVAAAAIPLLIAGCVTGSPSRTYVSNLPVVGDAIACAAHDLEGSGYETETTPGSSVRGERPLSEIDSGGEQKVGVVMVNLLRRNEGVYLRAGASVRQVKRKPAVTPGSDPTGGREGATQAAVDVARVEQDAARVVALCR